MTIVSSSSRPGVRRCTCGSTNAGASTSPAPSITRWPLASTVPSCGDRAAVDAHVEHGVDTAGRVEHARAADDEVVAALLADEDRHHATSTAVSTATGPVVSRS